MKITTVRGDIFDELFDPAEAAVNKARAELMNQIVKYARKNDLTQHELSKLLDVAQPRVSDLLNGKLSKFSLDTLVKFIYKLGKTVTMKVA